MVLFLCNMTVFEIVLFTSICTYKLSSNKQQLWFWFEWIYQKKKNFDFDLNVSRVPILTKTKQWQNWLSMLHSNRSWGIWISDLTGIHEQYCYRRERLRETSAELSNNMGVLFYMILASQFRTYLSLTTMVLNILLYLSKKMFETYYCISLRHACIVLVFQLISLCLHFALLYT